jgi:ankyrin repeat protein
VNELDRAGMTALVFAANKNNVRIVQLLRRAGARVEVVNNNLSGLMMAARNSSLELIQVMNPTAQEINIPAEDGWTAIYFAINRKDAGILRYLLDHGACTSVKDTYQQTPLQYAEELEWKEGAKILKRKNKC